MNWLIAASVVLVLIFGSLVAVWWWRLAARMAPYRDEVARREKRSSTPAHGDADIVIIPGTGKPRGTSSGGSA